MKRYYKLINSHGWHPDFKEGKIYNEDCMLGEIPRSPIKHHVAAHPIFWEEVSESEYLLQKAKEDYPVGTEYIGALYGKKTKHTGSFDFCFYGEEVDVYITAGDGDSVYYNGQWAEIIEPKKEDVCAECGNTGRSCPTIEEPDGIDCGKCIAKKPFQLEAGKEYVTRAGKRFAKILGIINEIAVGYFISSQKEVVICKWYLNGKDCDRRNNFDLIEKPEEPLSFTDYCEKELEFTVQDHDNHRINDGVSQYIEYVNDFEFKQELKKI